MENHSLVTTVLSVFANFRDPAVGFVSLLSAATKLIFLTGDSERGRIWFKMVAVGREFLSVSSV